MSKLLTPQQIATGDFFELLGLQNLSEIEKQEMLDKMNETIQARVYLLINEQLSPEERTELDTIPGDQMLDYLTQKGFDVPAMVAEEALRYRLEILGTYTMLTQPGDDETDESQP